LVDETPLRRGQHETVDGVRLLRPNPDIPYRDGAEERILELVRSAEDVSSGSTDILEMADGWVEEYHTHPARANVLRAFDIPTDARILEIGAGCGPITRYLGETAAVVDSVEPVLPRARVARERTRDLANVQVFAGNFEDVPDEPAYDIVVIVGVLEYVASGASDEAPYLAFLGEARRRLRPGGSLLLAIENKLGVKYLTGTGEDHSGRIFDSIEDYPRGAPARTFSSTALCDLVERAGFTPSLLGAFPDYKNTRVVFEPDRLGEVAPTLLEDLPIFPSRYAGTRSLALADEGRVWAQLVRDGLARHFPNSFVVVGSTEEPSTLWPSDRGARYFSHNRRRQYAAATTVRINSGDVAFERSYSPDPGALIADGMTAWSYIRGSSFKDAFVAADDEGRRALLARWRELVEARSTPDRVPLDAIPGNVLIDEDGELRLIDNEFHSDDSVDFVIERGLYWFAQSLARSTAPETWPGATTAGDLLVYLSEMLGLELVGPRLESLLAKEAQLQATVTTSFMGSDTVPSLVRHLHGLVDQDLWDGPLGYRLHDRYDHEVAANARLSAELVGLHAVIEHQQATIAALRDRVARLRERLAKNKARLDTVKTKLDRAKDDLREIRASRYHRLASGLKSQAARIRNR
jgi:SAM-dependent methyltransferase